MLFLLLLLEPVNSRWCLNSEAFINLQQLIRRFVDANESLELQCLYAIQLHLHNLQYPHGNIQEYNVVLCNKKFVIIIKIFYLQGLSSIL